MTDTKWICSDCGGAVKFVKTEFLDYVKPECTACGSGSARLVSKTKGDV